jgi:hypothetical protein
MGDFLKGLLDRASRRGQGGARPRVVSTRVHRFCPPPTRSLAHARCLVADTVTVLTLDGRAMVVSARRRRGPSRGGVGRGGVGAARAAAHDGPAAAAHGAALRGVVLCVRAPALHTRARSPVTLLPAASSPRPPTTTTRACSRASTRSATSC